MSEKHPLQPIPSRDAVKPSPRLEPQKPSENGEKSKDIAIIQGLDALKTLEGYREFEALFASVPAEDLARLAEIIQAFRQSNELPKMIARLDSNSSDLNGFPVNLS